MSNQDLLWNTDFVTSSELFKPLRSIVESFKSSSDWPTHKQINLLFAKANIKSGGGKLLKSISPDVIKNDPSLSYEMRCYVTGELETRACNWHDLMNALVWSTFPHAKAALNRRHYSAHSSTDITKSRTPERDTLTLFDECGVIVISSENDLLELIKNFAWKEVFWKQRDVVTEKLKAFVFGHGLYEQALSPYIGLTGKAILLKVDEHLLTYSLDEQLNEIDRIVEQQVNDKSLFLGTFELSPLPVLGLPGWYPDQNESFYDNKNYFRAGRKTVGDL